MDILSLMINSFSIHNLSTPGVVHSNHLQHTDIYTESVCVRACVCVCVPYDDYFRFDCRLILDSIDQNKTTTRKMMTSQFLFYRFHRYYL